MDIKQIFLSRLPQEILNKMPKIYHEIIDEGIEAITNGKASIEGRPPRTEEEWYILLSNHFVMASTAFTATLQGTRQALPRDAINITVNYRGSSHEFKFDPLEND